MPTLLRPSNPMPDLHNLFIFHLDSTLYAIPLAAVEQVIRAVEVTPLPGETGNILGVINMRGTIIAVVNTRRMLDFPEREVDPNDVFIITHSQNRTMALVVDDIVQVAAINQERLAETSWILPEVPRLKGITRLDGDIVLIHDFERCLSSQDAALIDTCLTAPAAV